LFKALPLFFSSGCKALLSVQLRKSRKTIWPCSERGCMKNAVLTALLLCSLGPWAVAEELTAERIYSSPSINGESIRGLKVSPDGSCVTFLRGKDSDYERLDLWEYNLKAGATRVLFDSDDLHSGAENLSEEEKARRERLRLTGSGIVDYEWSRDGKALFFPLAGDVYYWKVGNEKARKVVSTPQFETDVKFSPKGNYLSYIRNQNLYVLNLKSGEERAITNDGGGAIKNGMAEFVAQEEMDRMTGYWWSPDESKLAYTRVDESSVEEVIRSEIYAEEIKLTRQRYPFAGSRNAVVELAIVELTGGQTRWVDLGKDQDIYLPRVKWTRDPNVLSYQWQSRDQKVLQLRTVQWPAMKQRTLLEETSETWVNLYDDLKFLKDRKRFIWASERDGYKHLYLYRTDGKLIRQLTRGEWIVDSLKLVSERSAKIYFTGRKDTPLESHLYSVSLKGGKVKRVSKRSGTHQITFSKNGKNYLDLFSSVDTPPQISLHHRNGQQITWLLENRVDEDHPLYPYREDWIDPEFGSLLTADGAELYYRLYKPRGFDSHKKYPVIVYLYGGPHAQLVVNAWGRHFCQFMAQQGYAVFTLDNRGSFNRGHAFEAPLYKAMGEIEVKDQVEGVRFLRKLPWVDPQRIGVHGNSYGGYLTLMCMFKAPEYFKVGVSGAPVTDWRLYDTHYAERYLGNPKDNPEPYERSSVFDYATNLQGPLLVYHGMADDNVLFKNSTKLYKLLQDNNIPFSMMNYPGKKHRFSGKKTSMHRLNTILNFFDLHFGLMRTN
jgi:dipeptidyl-peptidase-4